MITECKYCATTFSAQTNRRIFCSDRCKVAYNRENALTCFYCGELPSSRDHITPHSVSGLKRRVWSSLDYVMCCRECNILMGAAHPFVLSDRIQYLIDKFIRKYKLNKPLIQWDEDELKDMGRSMRTQIRAHTKLWNTRQERLSHMRLRHLNVAHAEMQSVDKEDDKCE